jgi:hypothetical protein
MRFSSFSATFLMACGVTLASTASRTFGQVAVSGVTYELHGVNYSPLANVTIQVLRGGNPVLSTPVLSGSDGAFSLKISGPDPFDVAFFGPQKGPVTVPEIYTLAGISGTINQLHVTVYTIPQARKSGINLKEKFAYILPRIGPEAKMAVPGLTELLKNKVDAGSRTIAVEALGVIGPAARLAVPNITSSLKDENWQVRSGAAVALGQIGPEANAAVPALMELTLDPNRKVRDAATEALEKIKKK